MSAPHPTFPWLRGGFRLRDARAMSTVLVTGASGFVGSHVIPELLGGGHRVVATARRTAGMRVLPPASVPTASGVIPAATEAEAPPEDPPGVSARSQGLRVRGWKLESPDDSMP